jgi:GAF domain-containing protein
MSLTTPPIVAVEDQSDLITFTPTDALSRTGARRTQWVMRNRRSASIPNIYADARIAVDAYRSTFVRSLAMVPIRQLEPVGAIGNYWASHHRPADREMNLLQALADSTAVALENVRVMCELESARRESLERLALAAEYRDDGTHEHTARVANTSRRLARMLGFGDGESTLMGGTGPATPTASAARRSRCAAGSSRSPTCSTRSRTRGHTSGPGA